MRVIQTIFSKAITFIKEFWNIYGSIILSSFFSWLANWNVNQMATLNQYIGLTITFMCFLTVIKFNITNSPKNIEKKRLKKEQKIADKKKKESLVIEKAVSYPACVRNMKNAIDVENTINETNDLIINTMKGGKKFMKKIKGFFKWLWTYKEQVVGLLGSFAYAVFSVYCIICDKLGFIYEMIPDDEVSHIIAKVVMGLIAFLFVFFEIRNQVKWVGLGSLTKAQEYLDGLSLKTTSNLSNETKKKIKAILVNLKNELAKQKKYLVKCNDKVVECQKNVDVFNDFIKLSIPYNNEDYSSAITTLDLAKGELEKTTTLVETLEKKIAEYEKALA